MDDLYNHLDNYDDAEAISRLKAENSDLKHKLEDCYSNVEGLQQAFDNLETEFQRLQTNYSSLLKISRAEIQRKTEMIQSLHIEKDLLIIKVAESGSAHNVKQLIRSVREETEVKRKKKTRSKGQKGKQELLRRKSRPPSRATSSTSTDNSNTMASNERVTEEVINKTSKTAAQEKEPGNHEDNGPASPIADKRLSALSRRISSRLLSPATSSTSTDNSHKMTGNERVTDKDINKSCKTSAQEKGPHNYQVFHKDINKSNTTVTQEMKPQNHEVFPDIRPASPMADKWVSALSRAKIIRTPSPATSSTKNKMAGKEIVTDKDINKYSKTIALENEPQNHKDTNKSNSGVPQEIETQKHDVPENRPASPIADKRLIALSRRKSLRTPSPANSSNTTDYSNKMTGNERVTDKDINKYSKTSAQEKEPHNHQVFHKDINKSHTMVTQEMKSQNHEVFPDIRPASPMADKRLSALSRHQLAKLSSDEEFEDMYSALKPNTTREPNRNRKRGRDDSHDGKAFNSSHSRPYPDLYRERLNRNKSGRFSDNERNTNREKQHNESDRSTNRGKQYNNDRNRYANDSRYQRFSPERYCRTAKELGDDRYRTRRLESPPRERRRFGSPQRENHQFKRIRERRKSYHGCDREHREPETTIHGAYGEPQNKKQRVEPHHVDQEGMRPRKQQDDEEPHPSDMGSPTSKSPDFSHTEESSNEATTAAKSDIRSTVSPLYMFEDPRRHSELYVKCSEGNGKALQCAHANKTHLQPLDKSLWNLQQVQVPKALRSNEISEEQVDKMDIDKALSIASLESGELGSETTDTAFDDNCDFQDHNKQNDYNLPDRNESRKIYIKPHKENSPVDNHMPKDNRNRRDSLKKESKTIRQKLSKAEKATNRRRDEPLTPTSEDSHKADEINKHSDITQMPSILQKLMHSMNEKIPVLDSSVKLSNSREENEPKKIAESRISNKTPKAGPKSKPDFKPDIKNTDKTEQETEKNREKEPKKIAVVLRISKKTVSTVLKTRDEVEDKTVSEMKTTAKLGKETENNKSKISDTNEKKSLKKRDKIEPKTVSELKASDNPEKVTQKCMEKEVKGITESKMLDRNEKESVPSYEIEHKHVSELKTTHKLETIAENNVTIFRDFEHRVYSRHIVEGDLELSDESNDEGLLNIEELKKTTPKRKSHRATSKETIVDSDTTRKTRSQKDKEIDRKNINKFSELFGDSSSLITPEELNLATRTAHGLPADCCPPAAEEAQDIIIDDETPRQTTKDKSDFRDSFDKPNITEEKCKHKDSQETSNRTKHKQNKDLENEIELNEKHKDSSAEVSSEIRKEVVATSKSHSGSEENLVQLDYRIKRLQNTKRKQKNDAELNEKPKDSLKSNKRPKTKGEKKLSHSEHREDINTNENYNIPEPTPNNTLNTNDNKENTSKNSNLEGNVSNEMSRIFENTNTIVPSKTPSSDVSEINKEIPQLNDSAKDIIPSNVIQDVPNLASVAQEPGLVKLVVISTGVQPPHSNSTQHATSFNALASSTPAKDLSSINMSSEMETQVNHSAQVSVTIAREDSVSQPEADVPDMRITCYRRRRRVLKR